MKKFGLLIFAAALIVGVIAASASSFGKITGNFLDFSFVKFGKSVKGSGQTATEMREVDSFHAIEVSGVLQVEIIAQKEQTLEVEADDNLLKYIKTEVRGGTLKMWSERQLKTSNPLRVRITVQDIDDLEVTGAANVTVKDLKNSGIKVDSSGASKIKVSGESSKFIADVSGATSIDAEALTVENATVDASGASNVSVNVSGTLRAEATGASRVSYAGTPKEVVKKTRGAGSVDQR